MATKPKKTTGATSSTSRTRESMAAFAVGGHVERAAVKAHQETQENKRKEQQRGGRKSAFGEAETTRITLVLPLEIIDALRKEAAIKRKTIAQVVADFAETL